MWEGHKFWKKIPLLFWRLFSKSADLSKQEGDFFKFLWPFQKSWTLQSCYVSIPKYSWKQQRKDDWNSKTDWPGITSQEHQFYDLKVQLFWKGHKNLKKSPSCFDKSADLTSKQEGDFFQILWPSHNVLTLIIRN